MINIVNLSNDFTMICEVTGVPYNSLHLKEKYLIAKSMADAPVFCNV